MKVKFPSERAFIKEVIARCESPEVAIKKKGEIVSFYKQCKKSYFSPLEESYLEIIYNEISESILLPF